MPLLKRLRALAHIKPERSKRNPAFDHAFHHLAADCPRIFPLPCVKVSEQDDLLVQNQSFLISRLPFEIRQLIFEDVVHIGVLHVFSFAGHLAYVACTEPSRRGESTLLHQCWRLSTHEEVLNRYGHRQHRANEQRGLLSLLATCRQILIETIEMFYSQNTFDFRHLEILSSSLSCTLPVPSFNALRTLHLSLHFRSTYYDDVPEEGCLAHPRRFPDDVGTWENACRALACMPGLRDLCVVMEGSWLHHDPKMRILDPLRKVRVHGSFDVFMPIPWDLDCEADWDANFNVIDTHEEGQCKFCG